jgi:hypothetical protein
LGPIEFSAKTFTVRRDTTAPRFGRIEFTAKTLTARRERIKLVGILFWRTDIHTLRELENAKKKKRKKIPHQLLWLQ